MAARPPAPRSRPRSPRRWLVIAAVVGLFAGVVVISGVTIIKRIETGRWQVPHTQDFVRVVKGKPRGPSKTIFLERAPIELRPGTDDGPAGISSVLASAANRPIKLPGWKGTAAGWQRVVACIDRLFAPFDVTVTDQRPAHDDFVLVVIGGKPADLGVKDARIGGLAPFNGDVIPKPVVFAFSAALRHNVTAICETVGMEVAHAYGLDHGYDCKDVMTYLSSCGAKRFVDKDVRCGEKKARTCEGGAPTQNSYRHLAKILGMKR